MSPISSTRETSSFSPSRSPPLPSHLLPLFLILIAVPRSLSDSSYYSNCTSTFSCGDVNGVGYPFWGGNRAEFCGYPELELTCENNTVTTIMIQRVKYRVLGVDPETQILRITREDFMNGICSTNFLNTTFDLSLFKIVDGYTFYSIFYGCAQIFPGSPGLFTCSIDGVPDTDGYILPEPEGSPSFLACKSSVVVPISSNMLTTWGSYNSSALTEALQHGFEVTLNVDSAACSDCTQSKGVCGYDFAANSTTCYCPDQLFGSQACPSAQTHQGSPVTSTRVKKNSTSLGIGLGIGGAAIGGILVGLGCFYTIQRKRMKATSETKNKVRYNTASSKTVYLSTSNFSRSTPSYPSSLKSDLEKGSTCFGVQIFDYAELQEATENFDPSKELGDGGFGTVYYGELHDGRVVAIKRLYENNAKRVGQFINEVEILTRLHHQNLVQLYGCTSKRSRELLLVYEYIPNGTVADHLYGRRASSNFVPWRVRLNIAIETADALAYLHASDVVHRDVKTNNILLDSNFHVKVADFGLSRLFPTDVTHISTTPQGTPGYVDPEYCQCYQLTDKSDVYSFGVVLCELLSSKPAVDTSRHRQDINLASMAMSRIQNCKLHELVDPSLGFETDYSVRRMMKLVAELAFQCLQEEKDMRPTMERVLDILKRIGTEQISEQKAEAMDKVLETLRGFKYDDAMVKKGEVIDIQSDDIGLLKNVPSIPSSDSDVYPKWGNNYTTPNSV